MPTLKHEFELRRVIFGLINILATPVQLLPAIVAERLPEIMRQLSLLCNKSRDQRLLILKDNEQHLEQETSKKNEEDDDEEDETEIEGEGEGEEEEKDIFAKAKKTK